MPATSIIIPTFKRVEQTVRTIQLLLGSDGIGKSFEVEIIVSDSTPDETLKTALVNAFPGQVLPLTSPNATHKETPAVEAPRLASPVTIMYVRPPKPGIAVTKNAGARAARYPILIFCDSDIEVEHGTLALTLEFLKSHDSVAAVGSTVVWRGGPHEEENDRPRPEDRMKIIGSTTYTEAIYSRYMATYKEVFWQVGGYDEVVFNMRGEGSDLSARYWRAGFPLSYDSKIVVYHIHEAPESLALRVPHPEWGIARDLLLLAYKYRMLDEDYPAFASTVAMNFTPLGARGSYRMLQGIGKHYDMLVSVKQQLDAFRAGDTPAYDFKFLEVFSNEKLFHECLSHAQARVAPYRIGIC